VSPGLRRRLERLEARHRAAGERVRHVWWRREDPYPEAAPGERLIVTCWQAEDAPSPAPPGSRA
jgi:hypothetical protein